MDMTYSIPMRAAVRGVLCAVVLIASVPLAGQQTIVTATAVVRGRVLAAAARTPIRGAHVRVRAQDGRDNRLVTTDDQGQFEARDLTPGRWSIMASKAGFISQQVGQTGPLDAPAPVELADGQRLVVEIALTRGSAIAGRVTDEYGEPIVAAQVQALRSRVVRGERQLVALGTVDQTDDLGAYRVHGLPPGDYLVSASVRSRENTFKGDLMTVATYFPGTTRAGEAQPITVRAGEDQLGIDIAAPPRAPGTTISGVVFNSSGAPASGAEIHLLDSGNLTMMIGAKGVFVTADASGRFTASNVRPGSYVLDVAGWERSPQDFERATVPIEVPATGVTGITITMIPHRPVRLTGSVVADSGSTLPQALEATLRAQTVGSPGGGQNVLTQGLGTTGRFTLDGLSGRYTLEIEVATPGWMLKRLEIDGRDATDSAVDFSGGASTATARVILTDRIAEVSGTVTLGGSDTRATVVIFPDDAAKWSYPSRFVKTARTGGDGRFTIAGLAEGRYRMVAVSYLEEDEAYDPAFLERMKRPATDLRLAEGEKRSVTLPLTRR